MPATVRDRYGHTIRVGHWPSAEATEALRRHYDKHHRGFKVTKPKNLGPKRRRAYGRRRR